MLTATVVTVSFILTIKHVLYVLEYNSDQNKFTLVHVHSQDLNRKLECSRLGKSSQDSLYSSRDKLTDK